MSVKVSPFSIDLQKRSISIIQHNFKEGDFAEAIENSGLNGGPLHMNLHVKNIPPLHNEIIPYVLHHLTIDQTLNILEIEGTSIYYDHMIAIGHSLKTNTNLKELVLDNVYMSRHELTTIMTSLTSNNCLKYLVLSHIDTDFYDVVVVAIVKMLNVNTTLTSLDLSENKLWSAVPAICEAVQKNKHITRLDISHGYPEFIKPEHVCAISNLIVRNFVTFSVIP